MEKNGKQKELVCYSITGREMGFWGWCAVFGRTSEKGCNWVFFQTQDSPTQNGQINFHKWENGVGMGHLKRWVFEKGQKRNNGSAKTEANFLSGPQGSVKLNTELYRRR